MTDPEPTRPPPEPEITLEEWIAAGQSCCGVDRSRDDRVEPDASWTLWRIDDNGNTFAVREGLGRDEADRLAAEFTARGHKQMYWVEQTASST
jgi:hypothetical protein